MWWVRGFEELGVEPATLNGVLGQWTICVLFGHGEHWLDQTHTYYYFRKIILTVVCKCIWEWIGLFSRDKLVQVLLVLWTKDLGGTD